MTGRGRDTGCRKAILQDLLPKGIRGSILRRNGGMEASPLSCLYEKNQYTHECEAQAVELIVRRWHGPLMMSFFIFLSFFFMKSKLMGGGLSCQVLEI